MVTGIVRIALVIRFARGALRQMALSKSPLIPKLIDRLLGPGFAPRPFFGFVSPTISRE